MEIKFENIILRDMIESDIEDYESMGFAKAQGQNNLTAHWTVPMR